VFDNKDNSLFPQQFVNMRLLVNTLTDQLVVPNVAIQNGQQGTFVYTVDENSKVHLKPVQVGITTDASADILSGVAEGDRVVVDGTDRLSEGLEVRVRQAGDVNNPAGPDGAGGGRGAGRGGNGGANGRPRNGDGATRGGSGGPSGGAGAPGGGGNFQRGDGNFKKGQRGGTDQ
jgi:membrane fusion protein, multidrug efflux system